jgi:hypothetical protein
MPRDVTMRQPMRTSRCWSRLEPLRPTTWDWTVPVEWDLNVSELVFEPADDENLIGIALAYATRPSWVPSMRVYN